MSKEENIRVSARIRPCSNLHANVQSCLTCDPATGSISVTAPDKQKQYTFNSVLSETSNQEFVYAKVAEHVVDGFLNGINGTIFAYGQTGSGKTFTMIGPEVNGTFDHEKRGIIPRSLEAIFQVLESQKQKKQGTFEYRLSCTFAELYNEKMFDLLSGSDEQLQVRVTMDSVHLQGAVEELLENVKQGMDALAIGWNQRKVAETAMNRESSRSHAIFTLLLETTLNDGGIINKRHSRLNLVDLAGSERQAHTKNTNKERLAEAGNINKSLSTLARIIRSLVKNDNFISYRDSLLTLILKDSLGGNSRTAVVVNVHPNLKFVGDTLSTLNFAENVKKVKNMAVINENISCQDIDALKSEVIKLKEQIAELTSKQNVQFVKDPKEEEMVSELQQKVAMLEEFHRLYLVSNKENDKLKQKYLMQKSSIEFLTNLKGFNPEDVKKLASFYEGELEKRINEVSNVLSEQNGCDVDTQKMKREISNLKLANSDLNEKYQRLEKEHNELNEKYTSFMCRTQKTKQIDVSPSESVELSRKERRKRRQTQFTPNKNSLAPMRLFPDDGFTENENKKDTEESFFLKRKLTAMEDDLAESERARLDLEIKANQLIQVVNDREALIAKLESSESDKINSLFEEAASLKEELDGANCKLKLALAEAKDVKKANDDLKSRVVELDETISRQLITIKGQNEEIVRLKTELTDVQALRANMEELMEAYEREQFESRLKVSSPATEETTVDVEAFAKLKEEKEKLENDLEFMRKELEKKTSELSQRRKLRTSTASTSSGKDHDSALKELTAANLEKDERIEQLLEERDQLEGDFNNKIKNFEKALESEKEKNSKLDMEMKRLVLELNTLARSVIGSSIAGFETRMSIFGGLDIDPKANLYNEAVEHLQQQRRRLTELEFLNKKLSEQAKRNDSEELEKKMIQSAKRVEELEEIHKEDVKKTTELNARVEELTVVAEKYVSALKEVEELKISINEVEKQKVAALADLAERTGHQNHNQKIQYFQKVKNELIETQKENAALKARIQRLEKGKENAVPVRR